MDEKSSLISLSTFIPFGPVRLTLLKKYFGSFEKAWDATEKDFLEIGVKKELLAKFLKHRWDFDISDYKKRLTEKHIKTVTILDSDYSVNLKDLSNMPFVLYVLGDLVPQDSNACAIVGTRKPTTYGREVAHIFSKGLAEVGVTIVSGLALGIDSAAHRGALDVQGRTLAVIGCGLDIIYPTSNLTLAREIIKGHGAILSEYPLGYPALRNNFPSRNRIISGLSKAVIVVEGAQKSGTLLTASAAAEQGRTVFAVPGQITSPMSEAPHYLIQNGAKFAFSPKDILDEMNMELKVDSQQFEKLMPSDKLEEQIIKVLENEEKHMDDVARELKLDVSEVSAKLSLMQIKGMVKGMGEGIYKIKNF